MPKLTETYNITRTAGSTISVFDVVNIPFPVKQVRIKCLAMTSTSPGNSQYILTSSDIIDNKSMGLIWGDSITSFNPYPNIDIVFNQSRQIFGQYSVTFRELDQSLHTTPVGVTEWFCMILEYTSDSDE